MSSNLVRCFYCRHFFPESDMLDDGFKDFICSTCHGKYIGGKTPEQLRQVDLPWYIKTIVSPEGIPVLHYSPLPSIAKFHASKAYHRCIVGPRGSGKTRGALLEKYHIALRNYPRINRTSFLILRKIYEDLKKSTRKAFFEIFPHDRKKVFYNDNEKTAHIILPGQPPPVGHKTGAGSMPGICEFVFSAAEREDDYKKFLSAEYSGVLVDEAVEMLREIRDNLVPCVRYPIDFPEEEKHIDLITNPPDSERHWIWECFYPASRKKLLNHALFLNPAFENKPLLFKQPHYYDEMLNTMSPDMAHIYVYGLVGYVQKGDPFYPWFRRDVHEFDKTQIELPPYGRLKRGWDFGQRMGVCLFVYEDEYGNLDIIDEVVMARQRGSTHRLAEEVIRFTNLHYPDLICDDYCDYAGNALTSAAELTDIEILELFNIYPAAKPAGKETYRERTNIMYQFLAQQDLNLKRPRLRVDKSCTNIIRGFLGGYRHDKPKETVRTQPLRPVRDGHYEHFFNALEYILINIYGTIDELTRGQAGKPKHKRPDAYGWEDEPERNEWGYLGRIT